MRLRSKEENRVRQIPLVQICPGKAQPRKNFSNEELLELEAFRKTEYYSL